ncbi:MAG: urease accessory protein UreE [Deltaproteobacteria bacterium]|nr:urease accessory protein UreE [Deltaproteobacteria bacterium]
MRRLVRAAPAGDWPSSAAVATVTLDFDARHRRRIRIDLDGGGGEALLDLERAVALAAGDGLQAESGEWVAVVAAPEPVLEIEAADARLRMRLAWHLGNRHVPAEITADGIRIRPDHVLRAMLEQLGARVREAHAAFQPEGGAYAETRRAHVHAHGEAAPGEHADAHAHAHADAHSHAQAHAHPPGEPHSHAHAPDPERRHA